MQDSGRINSWCWIESIERISLECLKLIRVLFETVLLTLTRTITKMLDSKESNAPTVKSHSKSWSAIAILFVLSALHRVTSSWTTFSSKYFILFFYIAFNSSKTILYDPHRNHQIDEKKLVCPYIFLLDVLKAVDSFQEKSPFYLRGSVVHYNSFLFPNSHVFAPWSCADPSRWTPAAWIETTGGQCSF